MINRRTRQIDRAEIETSGREKFSNLFCLLTFATMQRNIVKLIRARCSGNSRRIYRAQSILSWKTACSLESLNEEREEGPVETVETANVNAKNDVSRFACRLGEKARRLSNDWIAPTAEVRAFQFRSHVQETRNETRRFYPYIDMSK